MEDQSATVEQIEAQHLRIHPQAQRKVTQAKLKAMIRDLDLDAIGVLSAVRCPVKGEIATWVIDGQHRLLALLHHGFGELVVDVKVYHNVENTRANDLFIKLNTRATVSPWDRFEKGLNAGYPAQVGAVRIAARHGFEVAPHSGNGKITCVSALESVYRLDEGRTLNMVLQTIREAWGHTTGAVEGNIIRGLSSILHRHNGQIDQASLVRKLAKYPGGPSGLIGNARGLRSVRTQSTARCVSELVIDMYNKHRRTGALSPL